MLSLGGRFQNLYRIGLYLCSVGDYPHLSRVGEGSDDKGLETIKGWVAIKYSQR